MNGFLDHFLVGLALLAAFGYASYALGPRALRRRFARVIAAALTRLPEFLQLRGTARRLAAAADKAAGACGGCDTCGSASTAATSVPTASSTPSAPMASAAQSSEIKIAVSAIGWRQRTRPPARR